MMGISINFIANNSLMPSLNESIRRCLMIKKISLVLIAFFGFFLMNCSNNSSDDPESPSYSSSQVDIPSSSSHQLDTPSSSSDDAKSSSSLQREAVPLALRAEPVAASNNLSEPILLDLWEYEGKNWYVIDAGYIKNTFVSSMTNILAYTKGTTSISWAWTSASENIVTTNMTETVSNSVVISDASTNTTSIEDVFKMKGTLGYDKVFKVEGSLEKTITNSSGTSRTISVHDEKSTQTSISSMTSHYESFSKTTSLTIGNKDEDSGYYRYALYAVSDVYFLISTDSANENLLSWDVISCVREGTYIEKLDFSPDGKFDNSPITGTEIVFADDFYKTLRKPTPKPKIEKIEIKDFNIPNTTHTYTFNKSFPATIEIYAVGGGGGGQGGNSWELFGTNWGTGGGGGGGATAYMKVNVSEKTAFEIKVGEGGQMGAGRTNGLTDNPGYPGNDGGTTTVSWSAYTIAVGGGAGGGKSGGKNGGSGAEAPRTPFVSYLDWGSANGVTGTIGEKGGRNGPSNNSPAGGSAGKLSKGYLGTFPSSSIGNGGKGGGGNDDGAWPGVQGNPGQVIIVVTYYE